MLFNSPPTRNPLHSKTLNSNYTFRIGALQAERIPKENEAIESHTDVEPTTGVPMLQGKINYEDSREDKREQRETWRFRLEIAGAIILFAYTTLAGVQSCEIRNANQISMDIFNAGNRPYLGLSNIDVVHVGTDSSGKEVSGPHPTKDTSRMDFRVNVKNFGTVPARNCKMESIVSIDGKTRPVVKIPDSPSTQFPTQSSGMPGGIGGPIYKAVMSGQSVLEIRLSLYYEWPGHHQAECDIERYDPFVDLFLNLGPCPSSTVSKP